MRLASTMVVLVLLGCGNKPVSPTSFVESKKIVARQLLPNVMLLVSRSSSMLTNTSTVSPCPSTIGACGPSSPCPAGCPTRLSDVQAAFSQTLGPQGGLQRVGVAVFPHDAMCTATGNADVLVSLPPAALSDDPAQLQQLVSQANTQLANIVPGGQSPAADSLRFVGTLPQLDDADRANFVLFVTDGAPDCSASAADDTVAAVNSLRQNGIKTIVVGVGPDALTPAATDALGRAAKAGGFARACPNSTDAECGANDSCDTTTRLCHTAFFSVANATDLVATLNQLGSAAPAPDVCDFMLEHRPIDMSHLSVSFNGGPIAGCETSVGCNTWLLDNAGTAAEVHFLGTLCHQLENATPQVPAAVQFTIEQ